MFARTGGISREKAISKVKSTVDIDRQNPSLLQSTSTLAKQRANLHVSVLLGSGPERDNALPACRAHP